MFDKPFERPIEFARALLEEESFILPDLPVGPAPEPKPKPKPTADEQAARPVEPPIQVGEPFTPSYPSWVPQNTDAADLPLNTISTEPGMALELGSPPDAADLDLPVVELPKELETKLDSPTGFGTDATALPQVTARSPRDPELNVEVPQMPPEAGRVSFPESEIPPTPPKPVSLQNRRAESPLPTNLPEIFADRPLEPPSEPGFVEPALEPPKVYPAKSADIEAAFPPFPPIDVAFTEQLKPMGEFEAPDNTSGMIRDAVDRETLFINFGRD
jgi:hypothetical protein